MRGPRSADVAEFMGYRNLLTSPAQTASMAPSVMVGGARILGTAMGTGRGPGDRGDPPRRSACRRRWADRCHSGDRRISRPRFLCGRARQPDGEDLYFRSDLRVAAGEVVHLAAAPRRVLVYPRMSTDAPVAAPALRERGLDGVTLLVIPGVLFVLALFIYPFIYGLVLSFQPEGRRLAGELRQVLHRPVPLRYDLADLADRRSGDAPEHRAVGAGGAARAADAAPEAADHHPGDPDHARHRDGGRRAADLSRSARLAEPHLAGVRPDHRSRCG